VNSDLSRAVFEHSVVNIAIQLPYGWARITVPRDAIVEIEDLRRVLDGTAHQPPRTTYARCARTDPRCGGRPGMPQGVVVTMAGFTGVSGAVALLTGLAGLRRIRRLRRAGLDVWALVKRTGAVGGEDNPRPVLQYTTEDGRVMEVGSPVPASKRQPFAEGSHVLVRYDPEDPRELVLYGHERAAWEYATAGVGAVFLLLGAGLLLG
jgi:hypothetical protein